VPIAQEAVYERTCEILRDDFLLQGTRKKVTSAA
jgi:hypothetical protein